MDEICGFLDDICVLFGEFAGFGKCLMGMLLVLAPDIELRSYGSEPLMKFPGNNERIRLIGGNEEVVHLLGHLKRRT